MANSVLTHSSALPLKGQWWGRSSAFLMEFPAESPGEWTRSVSPGQRTDRWLQHACFAISFAARCCSARSNEFYMALKLARLAARLWGWFRFWFRFRCWFADEEAFCSLTSSPVDVLVHGATFIWSGKSHMMANRVCVYVGLGLGLAAQCCIRKYLRLAAARSNNLIRPRPSTPSYRPRNTQDSRDPWHLGCTQRAIWLQFNALSRTVYSSCSNCCHFMFCKMTNHIYLFCVSQLSLNMLCPVTVGFSRPRTGSAAGFWLAIWRVKMQP